ncbi:hypothetical protein PPACK8108_LOCUS23119 [Phakopsora pachyrhizi]|uniref:Kinesin motor domain-containing protein n=1 Tax=Phakopsora pachyrhizi TaxID=170000 RepID=A0AAV0BQ69_PHAPC|nr:hypothetical protein PPACK8108_LOCUS23119 [Phakopsora pachyrhizi]
MVRSVTPSLYNSNPSATGSGRTTPSYAGTGRLTPSLGHRSATPSAIPSLSSSQTQSTSAINHRPASVSYPIRKDSLAINPAAHLHRPTSTASPTSHQASFSPQSQSQSQLSNLSSSSPESNPLTQSAGSASVQVVLRIRPFHHDANVPSRFQRSVINPLNSTTVSIEASPVSVSGTPTAASSNSYSGQSSKNNLRFTFDRVYAPDEGQSAIWSSVEALVGRFLEGYNVTVFAYGQTSSGKSYTMGTDRVSATCELDHSQQDDLGVDSDRLGIIPRAVQTIFQRVNQISSPTSKISLKASYVEIYNEDLIDLVACSQSASSMLPQVTIREDKDGNIIWSGLREVQVSSAKETMELLHNGSAVRQTNSTQMNAQSSRSHAIFSIHFTQCKLSSSNQVGSPSSTSNKRLSAHVTSPVSAGGELEGEWITVTSKFHFVDLAGSERLKRTSAIGDRIKEGISINSGLHALGNVISALGDPAKAKTVTHIPYRDSKLTRLLQDSLGGNAHTLMVACVSPTEYNVNETLNTLKYANRARNIKNRAQVNATEAGWEDVDYLQSLVLKLRKELANLKASGSVAELSSSFRALSSIDEEGASRGDGGPNYLALKDSFTELQAKYAKALSDLTQAQSKLQNGTGSSGLTNQGTIHQSSFEDMIQPVVEEYEKSITALESQLALTKAALAHSEQSMTELEEKLSHEQLINENQSNLLAELKGRLSRLVERESHNESYIKDLELKLKVTTESNDVSSDLVNELKKELAKLKEHDSTSEVYIKELEKKLSSDRDGGANLLQRIQSLESELLQREESYNQLEAKFFALSSSLSLSQSDLMNQQKELLEQLSEKESKLSSLELSLQEFRVAKAEIEAEKERLESAGEKAAQTNVELLDRIKVLETLPPPSSSTDCMKEDPGNLLTANAALSPRSFTPPATPGMIASAPLSVKTTKDAFSRQFEDLRERYESTVLELDDVQTKYNNAVKELEDMSAQLDESRLMQQSTRYPISRRSLNTSSNQLRNSVSNLGSLSPSPAASSPLQSHHMHNHPHSQTLPVKGFGTPVSSNSHSNLDTAEGGGEEVLLETLHTVSNDHSTSRSSPTQSLTDNQQHSGNAFPRRSVPTATLSMEQRFSSRNSSIGRPADPSLPSEHASHARSLSLSLSHEATASFPPINRGATSAVLLNTSIRSPRSVSPGMARMLLVSSDLYPNQQLGRSYESLEKEVIQLQEILKEREEEIRTLEISIREVRRLSDSNEIAAFPTSAAPSDTQRLSEDDDIRSTACLQKELYSNDGVTEALKSATDPSFSSKESNVQNEAAEPITNVTNLTENVDPLNSLDTSEESTLQNSKNIQRMDDLMRSMAQKESAHLELIDGLKDKLSTTKKQYDELVKLSRDQVVNMSSEIEALRVRLSQSEGNETDMVNQLNQMESLLMAKEKESEQAKVEVKALILKAESNWIENKESQLQSLKNEHLQELEELKKGQRDNLELLVASFDEKLLARENDLKKLERDWKEKLQRELRKQAEEMLSEFAAKQPTNSLPQDRSNDDELKTLQARFEEESQETKNQSVEEVRRLEEKLKDSLKFAEAGFETRLKELEEKHSAEVSELKKLYESQKTQAFSDPDISKNDQSIPSSTELEKHRKEAVVALEELRNRYEQDIEAMKSSHQEEMEELRAEHDEILVASLTELDSRRTKKLDATISDLQGEHLAELQKIQEDHKIQDDYEEKILALRLEHEKSIKALESRLISTVESSETEVEQKAHLRKISELTKEIGASEREMAQSEAETELQEALDALSTLDKALLESQAERERLLKQLDELRQQAHNSQEVPLKEFSNLQLELNRTKHERDELLLERNRFLDNEASSVRSAFDGPGSRIGQSLRSDSPQLVVGIPQRNHLLSSGKPPPPTPPPSIPPPPLPTALPGLPLTLNGRRTTRTSNASSQISNSHSVSGRDSPSTSVGTNSAIESSGIDPRILKKIDEQEGTITRLSRQLSTCEMDLKANMDLVANLESALNETERNLRKSRLQMTELAKDRDKMASVNESLRKELSDANEEVENVRNNVLAEKVQFENQLGEERRAKENAKKQLESRIEEMQASRMTRKSKFK